MAIAYVREFDVGADRTTRNYDEIGRRMGLEDDPPPGLILHAAGFAGAAFRMVEIWETAEDEERFARERLMPTVREVVRDAARPPRTERYELHALLAPALARSR